MTDTPQPAVLPEQDVEAIPKRINRDSSMPPFFSLIFSTRGMSLAVATIVIAQLTFYATDAVGLPAGVVGTLFLLARIFDAVTDLFINFLIDKTRTKWGKARPYELFLIPLWIFVVAVFSTPEMSQGFQIAYIFVMFWLITSVCQTALNASEAVYLKRALEGEERYAKVYGRQGVFVILAGGIGSVLLPQLIAAWGDQPGGWTRIAVVYAVPAMVVGMIRFFLVKERPMTEVEATQPPPTLKEVLRGVLHNKYAFYLGGLVFLGASVVFTSQTVGLYFFKYIVGDIGLMSVVSLGGVLLPFSFLLFPLAVRRVGAMNFVRIGLVVAIIGYSLVFFAPTNIVLVIVGSVLGAFGAMITMLVGFFNIQVMTYGQWKNGSTIEAAPQTVSGVANKLGSGFGPALVGGMLALVGYDGSLQTQSAEADTMIIALYSIIPALLCAAILALSFVWKLDNRMDAIRTDLENNLNASTSTTKI